LGVKDEDFDKMEKHGLFWIDFEDLRKYFRSFNLSCKQCPRCET
jgi:hypothetical protein